MSNARCYHFLGLRIVSTVDLPELADFAAAGAGVPDVWLGHGVVGHHRTAGWSFDADRWWLTVPDVATFQVTGGRSVVIDADPAADPRAVRLYLLSSALAALCYQRSLLPLHVGAVADDDGAIAFCGSSGAGKSSTVAWFVRQRWQLVCDDMTVLAATADGRPALWPSARRLRLWEEAVSALDWPRTDLQRDLVRFDKFVGVISPSRTLAKPVAVRAVYILAWGEPARTRLRGSAAVAALAAATAYRPELGQTPAAVAGRWRTLTDVARHVPIWRLSRPRDWERLEEALRVCNVL